MIWHTLSSLPSRWIRKLVDRHPRLGLFLYPPYLGTGIRVARLSPDFREIRVEMPLLPWNRNYVGTHFGGSLYAMCDPFFMLMLIRNLGTEFEVWDQAATIRFLRPGRGMVVAEFRLDADRIEAVRAAARAEGRIRETFGVTVREASGQAVAEVEKVIYVRWRGADGEAGRGTSG